MAQNYVKLSVHKHTKEKLLNEVRKLFLEHNPKLKNVRITEDFLINWVIDYYLEN